MNAVKFVKEYGLNMAIIEANNDTLSVGGISFGLRNELKRLVESYELVESRGGLNNCKKFMNRSNPFFHPELEKAIADVEKCL